MKRTVRSVKSVAIVRTTKSEAIEQTTKCLSTVRTTKSEATKGQYSKVGSNRRSMVFIVGEPIAKKRYDRESE